MILNRRYILLTFLLWGFLFPLLAQRLTHSNLQRIEQVYNTEAAAWAKVRPIRILSAQAKGNTLYIQASVTASYLPYRKENIAHLYTAIRRVLPVRYRKHKIVVRTGGKTLERLLPIALQHTAHHAPTFRTHVTHPLVERSSSHNRPTRGLQHRHLALWHSHGLYYDIVQNRWQWQRARLLQTVEDLYPMSYVVPLLTPMLENAGANVLLPRERDINPIEVIADNDQGLDVFAYSEKMGKQWWKTCAEKGFAHLQSTYVMGQNPFVEGTARKCATTHHAPYAVATWRIQVPQTRSYAVYVTYPSVAHAAPDAHYSVYHSGGVTHFKVNQRMGGGTWVYLGTFQFSAHPKSQQAVCLTNQSSIAHTVVTADAVKIGGGMGNIARAAIGESPSSSDISHYPRYSEGASYWLQWAGMPESIYSESLGHDDYKDDLKSRPLWVNYLVGGSSLQPHTEGLKIPLDLSFALHTDAGMTANDTVIGTLAIYSTRGLESDRLANGAARTLNRDLADQVQTQVVDDIRSLYDSAWVRRGLWDKKYYEVRVPHVPAMILELLSHQNFADMRYGHDPRFRFNVARAIYKGILKFVAAQNKQAYVVQPLPVQSMALKRVGQREVQLTWRAQNDPLEVSARPKRYIVYIRKGEGGFDNGRVVQDTVFRYCLPLDTICSFKVTALNEGGESFPSEILAAGIPKVVSGTEKGGIERTQNTDERSTVLVVNGFTRLSSPYAWTALSPSGSLSAGFVSSVDFGVPYISDIAYVGSQKDMNRTHQWIDNDNPGYGASYADYEKRVVAGNTFDYPYRHGEALMAIGYSFVSASVLAVEENPSCLDTYKVVDWIGGKQKRTMIGGQRGKIDFQIFTPRVRKALSAYFKRGGNLFLSGSYVGTDAFVPFDSVTHQEEQRFAMEQLHYKWHCSRAVKKGEVHSVKNSYYDFSLVGHYMDTLSSKIYVVESPDAISPVGEKAATFLRYGENEYPAGVLYDGAYRSVVIGFPFETLIGQRKREEWLRQIMHFLNDRKEKE